MWPSEADSVGRQQLERCPQGEGRVTWYPLSQETEPPETLPHHLGRGQHQDDKPHLAGILPPVLRADQAADAYVSPQQGLGGTAGGTGGHTAHGCHPWELGLHPRHPELPTMTPVTSVKEEKRPGGMNSSLSPQNEQASLHRVTGCLSLR